MNIFKDFENVAAMLPSSILKDSLASFWKLTGEIRNKLGENKLLLNNYLSEVFEVLNCADLQNASFFADSVCWAVLGDCYTIVEPDCERNKSNYFELVEKYISENLTDIKHSHTKAEYYAVRILLKHLEIFADDFVNSLKEKFNHLSFSNLNHYFQEMAKIVSEDRMEYLNDLICEAFFMCPAGLAFIGQIVAQCVGMLVYRDPDTSKQIFEIILEGKRYD